MWLQILYIRFLYFWQARSKVSPTTESRSSRHSIVSSKYPSNIHHVNIFRHIFKFTLNSIMVFIWNKMFIAQCKTPGLSQVSSDLEDIEDGNKMTIICHYNPIMDEYVRYDNLIRRIFIKKVFIVWRMNLTPQTLQKQKRLTVSLNYVRKTYLFWALKSRHWMLESFLM